MNTDFTHATKLDLECIIQMAKKTIDCSYRYFLGNKVVEQYLQSQKLDQYLTEHITHAWLLTHESNSVGFAVCIDNIIDFMLIDSDYQRRGFGTQLLQHCEVMLYKNNSTIALESFEQNTHANQFYLANDWQLTEKHTDIKSGALKYIFLKHNYSPEEIRCKELLHPNPYKVAR